MNQNDNYLREISELWVIKEKIYEETKKMDFKQYLEYLKKNIQPLKKRLEAKIMDTETAALAVRELPR
jgi:two-component sensor histidine kinase